MPTDFVNLTAEQSDIQTDLQVPKVGKRIVIVFVDCYHAHG